MGAPHPYCLLLVEDNLADADLVQARLETLADYEFETIHVTRLQDAIDHLSNGQRVDAVVLDLNLPDSTGIDTVKRLREYRDDVAVIVLSGHVDDELRRSVYSSGAQDFIGKDEPLARVISSSVLYALERHRAQEQQRQMEKLVSISPDAVLVVDESHTIRFANSTALRLFEKERSELIGQPFAFDCDESAVAEIEIPQGEGVVLGECRVVPCEWGEEKAFLASIRDVTEQRRLSEQLRQAQKMEAIGRLAGGVAHDFNNLLSVIIGYSEILERELEDSESNGALLREIMRASSHAADLTRQLLAFSRQQMMQPQRIDLNGVVKQMQSLLRRVIGEDIELAFNAPDHPYWVDVDPTQIDQVIMNLALNARDAMPDGGRLTFETEILELGERYFRGRYEGEPGAYVMLAVSDNGCGMDRRTLARIFEPFFTTKESGKGTGLGLAMAFGIVKQSGGHINVYSEPGIGTTFRVYLPESKGPQNSPESVRRSASPRPGHETVLLVEDEESVRNLIDLILKRLGYRVLAAASGTEGLEMLEAWREPVDLLITDLVMPGMDGATLAQEVVSRRPGTPVLYMSGYTTDASIQHGILKAGDHFLSKPFTPDRLTSIVREVLDGERGDQVEATSTY